MEDSAQIETEHLGTEKRITSASEHYNLP